MNEKHPIPNFDAGEWITLRGLVTDKMREVSATTLPGEKQDKLLAKYQALEDKTDEAASVAHANWRDQRL